MKPALLRNHTYPSITKMAQSSNARNQFPVKYQERAFATTPDRDFYSFAPRYNYERA